MRVAIWSCKPDETGKKGHSTEVIKAIEIAGILEEIREEGCTRIAFRKID